jgi:tRNA-2-methylthio-N6-dimethylallyladenosine synthase
MVIRKFGSWVKTLIVINTKDFSNELIRAIAEYRKVTEYLNLPVQSGDDQILKKMNRPYTAAHYKNLVKKIRAGIPEISLSTDVIVGFPGETKKQFENTAKLFREIKFDMAYIAKYSPRAGTAAEKLKDDVSLQEKKIRYRTLTKILRQTALENNKSYIGKEVDILINKSEGNICLGKTRSYKTVKIKSPIKKRQLVVKSGKFVKVRIINALSWGLTGVFV